METWQASFEDMKQLPWIVIQPIFAAIHLTGLFIPATRPIFSLLIECYQIVILAVFSAPVVDSLAAKSVLLLQFSHFKIADLTYSSQPSPAWLGFYWQLVENAYPLIIMLVLMLVVISFSACFGAKNFGSYMVRLFYRMLLLSFLPMTFFFCISVKYGSDGGGFFYLGIIIFTSFITILLTLFIIYMLKSTHPWDWEYERNPSNTLEFRLSLQHNGKTRQYFNVLVAPLFKLFLVLWTVFFEDKSSAANSGVTGGVFVVLLVYLGIIRPFENLFFNIYVIVSYILTGALLLTLLIGRQIDQLKDYGSYPVIALISLMLVLTWAFVVLNCIQARKKKAVKSADMLPTTETERSQFMLNGAIPMANANQPNTFNYRTQIAPVQRGVNNRVTTAPGPVQRGGNNRFTAIPAQFQRNANNRVTTGPAQIQRGAQARKTAMRPQTMINQNMANASARTIVPERKGVKPAAGLLNSRGVQNAPRIPGQQLPRVGGFQNVRR